MQLERLLPPTQAFSYLGFKPSLSEKQRLWKDCVTVASLFSMVYLAIWVQFPKEWVQRYLAQGVFFYALMGFFLAVKAILLIEAGGYFVHRYLEHLGFATRISSFFREGQKHHWAHHMTIYPLNKQYIKGYRYIDSQNYGIAWQWIIPLFLALLVSFYAMGWKVETLVFMLMLMGWAKFNEYIHARFHIFGHPFIHFKYFQWIADIHVLHHFDQEVNFSMTSPLMDVLFGTYLSPKSEFMAVKAFMKSNDLNSADFINWSYLLKEATPMEYAHAIAAIEKYPGTLKKISSMLRLLEQFQSTDFYYQEATLMKKELHTFIERLPKAFQDRLLHP